ncbi:hypothetical protein HYPSUDRAFT_48184 [Hypholoma sublateritium FD-334 SS-4]|uniref:Uncharacterized protein n=1 Tax=Hypholoma sublateritium (strain FD-334 SS-4) TaxID=945553 RepID=A0A0D2LXN4_HYPSF|nr:hypothetical protein HYPSUDRAFT_48184 [Hypholoma sublateritium FD-334 SS-4]
MPAHMDTPLDFTYPAWYRPDGTARTIRSGPPSIASASASSRAPSIAPSTSTKASTGTSTSASRTRARGPRELRVKDTGAVVHVHAHSVPVASIVAPRETPPAPLMEPAPMATPTASQLRRSEQARRFRAVPRRAYASGAAATDTAPASGSPHTTSRAIEPTGHPSMPKSAPLTDNPPTKANADPDPDVIEQLRRWEAMHAAALRTSSSASSSFHGASPDPTPTSSALPAPTKETPVLRTVARNTPRNITPSAQRERSQVAAVHVGTGTAPRVARRREGGRERGGAATLGAHGRRNEAWAAPRRDVDAEIAPGESCWGGREEEREEDKGFHGNDGEGGGGEAGAGCCHCGVVLR